MTFMAENNANPETPAMEAQPVTPVETTTTSSTTPTASTTTTTTKKGNNKTLWIILGILAFLCLCCLVTFGLLYASGAAFMQNIFNNAPRINELDNTTTTGGTQDTDDTDTNSDEDYDFSDLFSADGNFAVAVEDVDLDEGNYVITLDVKNQGDTPTTFSSLLYLSLVDENGETYSQNFFYNIPQEERLDLELEGGQTFRGKIAFLVEGNPSSLTLQVRDSLFDENPTEFEIK
jgi:flagellar basal body-associated protein FliL